MRGTAGRTECEKRIQPTDGRPDHEDSNPFLTAGVAGAAMTLAVGLGSTAQAGRRSRSSALVDLRAARRPPSTSSSRTSKARASPGRTCPSPAAAAPEAMTVLRARVTAGNRTDRGADARLRHSGLGRGRRARRPQCRRRGERLGRCGAGGASALRQVRRQVDLRPGQRPFDQLGVGQQGDPGRAQPRRALHVGRAGRRPRRDPGRRLRRARPRRPGLAGGHDLRRRPDVHGRPRVLPEVHDRARS